MNKLVILPIVAASALAVFLVIPDDEIDEPFVLSFAEHTETVQSSSTLIDPVQLALDIHAEVNRVRFVEGVAPLEWNDDIAYQAWLHTQDMVNRDYVAHVSPDGISPADRGQRAGFQYCGDDSAIQFMLDYDAQELAFTDKVSLYNNGTIDYQQSIHNELTREDAQLEQKMNMVNEMIDNDMIFDGFGENSGAVDLDYPDLVDTTVQGWLNSTLHKENMLLKYWDSTGVGVSENGTHIIVNQNFC